MISSAIMCFKNVNLFQYILNIMQISGLLWYNFFRKKQQEWRKQHHFTITYKLQLFHYLFPQANFIFKVNYHNYHISSGAQKPVREKDFTYMPNSIPFLYGLQMELWLAQPSNAAWVTVKKIAQGHRSVTICFSIYVLPSSFLFF